MRQPLWIVNVALLSVLLVVCLFVVLMREKIPPRESIAIEAAQKGVKVERPVINTKKIYTQDLFGTYVFISDVKPQQEVVPEPPAAPVAQRPVVPEVQKPVFLPPLNVTLKGIVWVSDDAKNRVFIMDNKTNLEGTYKTGDVIEDAMVMRVFPNKVIIARSNGQQEVLYLREKDAKTDPMFAVLSGWSEVVQEVKPGQYAVDPILFCDRVKNLAQFIDMLDLTTVYSKGKSIGCRVGNLEKDSLGSALGMRTGDIITHVDGISTSDIRGRLKIYKKLTDNGTREHELVVNGMRNKQPLVLNVTVQEKRPKPTLADIKRVSGHENDMHKIESADAKERETRALGEKYKFAPTLQEIRRRERHTALQGVAQPDKAHRPGGAAR